jgi:gliding motility-associated-like protein
MYNVNVIDAKKCNYRYDSISSIIIKSIPSASIIAKDTIVCNQKPISLVSTSQSAIQSFHWYLNNNSDTTSLVDSIYVHTPGYYSVVNNDGYCNSLVSAPMYIQAIDIPLFHIQHQPYICINTELPISTDANEMKYVHYVWDFGDSTTSTSAQPLKHTYKKATSFAMSLKVSNDYCPDSTMNYTIVSDSVWVINPISSKDITMFILKYTDSALQPKTDSGYVIYHWTPGMYLDNENIQHPIFHAINNMDYDLFRTDTVTLCTVKDIYHIISSDEVAVNVPKAFTPNHDNLNDVLKLEFGAGIKQFNYFTIFNRWGKMIFNTNNINKGWDGTFENEPQMMDMYSYIIDYITYKEEHIQKTGSFLLIR